MFDSDDNSIRNNVEWFLMGDFLWFSPWSGSLGENFNTHVCVYKYISMGICETLFDLEK